ncbi:MAG: 50S ribosomal protein L29 [Deltaproteobacteria bacterium]|nr:50S ribosomal protein L29 [Deltaproteobacteria bacterium]
MKATDLRSLSIDELATKVSESRTELFNLKVKHATGQLEDTARLRTLRREIARAETVKREIQEAQK